MVRVYDIDWDDAMQIARETNEGLLTVLESAITIGVAELLHRHEAAKVRATIMPDDPVRTMMAQLVTSIGPREAARALNYHRWHPDRERV